MAEPQQAPEPLLYWGTNQQGGTANHYAGRVHVVWPDNEFYGLCGLPIEEIWEQRPPVPDNLCPLCCVRAMVALFPAFSESLLTLPPGTGRHELAAQDQQVPPERPAEQTMLIPAIKSEDSFA
ncbi:hypothetical protein [Amycolatopsis sp. NPDC051716]|uniref:hypothetical protein n=1 Tax=Amycolatopsis sp. NPDC051716 TaxID=3155804 RepID=UPI0034496C50